MEPLLEELIMSVMEIAFQVGHCGPQRLGRQCPQSPLAKAQNLTHLRELEYELDLRPGDAGPCGAQRRIKGSATFGLPEMVEFVSAHHFSLKAKHMAESFR